MRNGKLTYGVLIPSFSSVNKHLTEPSTLRDCSQQIEELGYDSIWVIDHFLKAPVYGQTWLDPLLTLTLVAAVTKRVKLGTSVLIAPLRNPVLLAKEIATLQFFSGNRFIAGVGPGWNPIEYASVQVPRRERGRRVDEIIEILRLLLSTPSASFEGRYYQFPELAIEPLPTEPTPIWIGGGTQPMLEGSSEPQERAAETVIQRIARSDGWSSLPQATPDLLAADWQRIQAAARELGRDPAAVTFGHMNYFHLVDTNDRDKALDVQRLMFDQYVGEQRPWSYVLNGYLVGTIDDVVRKIKERAAVGATSFILGPVTSDPRELQWQLEMMATKVLPQLQGAAAGVGL